MPTAIARERSGVPSIGFAVDVATVLAALAEVPDPEIPVVSVVELGMVEEVAVEPDAIRVALLPTFVGCPALEVIRTSVERRLEAFGRPVDVRFEFRVPWTSDRISSDGRAKLLASGFAPPAPVRADEPLLVQLGTPVPCPNCGSRMTALENVFGPTQCRSIHHCTACRQPFESFKSV
ncbi:MAG: 1,2-phenylacetyl-CoA epoxidase subunit PaaD [Chloroflexota bacterium]